jgi:hypothetical protein
MSNSSRRKHKVDSADVSSELFRLGYEYYVVGRFGFFANVLGVAGNILHHSVEMLLKGSLATKLPLNKLEQFKHNLPKLWTAFIKANPKAVVPPGLEGVIQGLHQFESIRYPDLAVTRGVAVAASVRRASRGRIGGALGRRAVKLALSLEDVDKVVGAIFAVSEINPSFFRGILAPEARSFLTRENANAGVW